MTDADEIEKQVGGEGVTGSSTGAAVNQVSNNSNTGVLGGGGGGGLSLFGNDSAEYNQSNNSDEKRTSLLDVIRESLQRQGKVRIFFNNYKFVLKRIVDSYFGDLVSIDKHDVSRGYLRRSQQRVRLCQS